VIIHNSIDEGATQQLRKEIQGLILRLYGPAREGEGRKRSIDL
jgi:hypothetical protein